jgi:hypothetical protein
LLNDSCDGAGSCVSGPAGNDGAACDVSNECTLGKTCSAGACTGGTTVADNTPCSTDCRSNDTCQGGACTAVDINSSSFFPTCQYNWCGDADLCEPEYSGDGSCDCGCGFADPDCTDCSMWMCERNWCDAGGGAVDDCNTSLMDDGKCDCGCQFTDPDCYGGDCCSVQVGAGCNDAYIENCVCTHANGDAYCCGMGGGKWDNLCVQLAQQLGCAACP